MKNLLSTIIFIFLATSFFSQKKYIANQFLSNYFMNVSGGKLLSNPMKSNWKEAEWSLIQVDKNVQNVFKLVNVSSNLALDVSGDKLLLVALDSSSKTQQWKLTLDEKKGTTTIQNNSNSKYLINWSKPDELGLCDYFIYAQCSWIISDAKEKVEVSANTVEIYTMSSCGRCKYAKQYMTDNNIKFVEYDIKDKVNNSNMYQTLEEKTKFKSGSTIKMPVIVYSNEVSYNIKDMDAFMKEFKLLVTKSSK